MSREADAPDEVPPDRSLAVRRHPPMPISKCSLLASIVLWGSLLLSGFMLISYITVYVTLGNNDDLKGDCHELSVGTIAQKDLGSFKTIDLSNIKRTEQFTKAEKYLKIGSIQNTKSVVKSDIPHFVTAVSSATFYQVQGLLKQIVEELLPLYRGRGNSDVKLIVIDLGMTDSEKKVFERHCRCELWAMDKDILPHHVTSMDLYSYRSVIIQHVMSELGGSVIWMDPLTRLVSARIPEAISDARKLGFKTWPYSFPVSPRTKAHENDFVYNYEPVLAYTNPSTFKYLNEQRCKYTKSHIPDSRLMIFYDTDVVRNYILKPWASCVLDVNCVSPKSSRYTGCFDHRSPSYTGCHRYEMSVLSLIVENLPGYFVKRTFQPVLDTVPGKDFELEEYFLERPITRRQRHVIMVCVFIIVVVIATSSLWGSVIMRWIGIPIELFKPKRDKCRSVTKKYTA